MAKAKTYNYKGKTLSMKELAEIFNLSYCRMSNLMHKFNHDAAAIAADRSAEGAKRSGKNAKKFAVDTAGMTKMTVAEIAKVTGFSNAAISGKIKRGVCGLALLKSKKKKGVATKKIAVRMQTTTRSDKNLLSRQAQSDVGEAKDCRDMDRHEIRNAVEDYLAAGGKIQKLVADGSIDGQSWKDQAKKSWNKRTTLASKQKKAAAAAAKKKETVVAEKGKMDVNDFIKELESERDQRRAYGEVLHLAGSGLAASPILDTDLEVSLPDLEVSKV
jgi:DNA-binding transcriptional regulator GbsR (MarR family)